MKFLAIQRARNKYQKAIILLNVLTHQAQADR